MGGIHAYSQGEGELRTSTGGVRRKLEVSTCPRETAVSGVWPGAVLRCSAHLAEGNGVHDMRREGER